MSARRPWAWPLIPLYAAGLAAKDGLRVAGLLKTQRLQWPVVSVGSLSAGGAGKTPVVIALAELLHAKGWAVDVLSRGYGRRGSGYGRKGSEVERVSVDGEHASVRYGDEPVLIARRTGVPVWVGAERYAAGRAAEAAAGDASSVKSLHLLDDGFQHRQLARAVDVVLITEADLDDALLPAGNLREPWKSLRRADIVVVREEERERVLLRLRGRLCDATAIWTVRRSLEFASSKPALSVENPMYGHFVFCAIARPARFVADLCAAGIGVIDTETFPDHHEYTMRDVDNLIERSDDLVANAFVTTEKDAVKLSHAMRAKIEARGPLVIARLNAGFIDEDKVMSDLEARLK